MNSLDGIGDRRARWIAVAIVVLGLAVRSALMVPLLRSAPSDPDNYLELADRLASGLGYRLDGRPTAYRPPLYPIALAPGVALLGRPATAWVVALHLMMGAATIVLTGLAARRWGMSRSASLLAMFVVSCDPVLVSQVRGVMTETMAAAWIAALLASIGPVFSIRSALRTGLIGGLAALCRPSLLPAAVLVAMASMVKGPGRWPGRALRSAAMLVAIVATLAPWAIRNALIFGEPVWTTTHGGYTLFLANNPVYYDEVLNGPPGAVWSGPEQRRWASNLGRLAAGRDEPQADRLFRRLALRMLWERPRDFARATLARLSRFWAIAPSSAVYPSSLRWATAAWTVPLWGLLAVGLCRRRTWRWPIVAAPCILLALSAVHAFYWTDLRMRAPGVPAVALVDSAGWGELVKWRRKRIQGCHDRRLHP